MDAPNNFEHVPLKRESDLKKRGKNSSYKPTIHRGTVMSRKNKSTSHPSEKGNMIDSKVRSGSVERVEHPDMLEVVEENATIFVPVGGWTNPSEKYPRQSGNLPQVGVKIKQNWNHQPVLDRCHPNDGWWPSLEIHKVNFGLWHWSKWSYWWNDPGADTRFIDSSFKLHVPGTAS